MFYSKRHSTLNRNPFKTSSPSQTIDSDTILFASGMPTSLFCKQWISASANIVVCRLLMFRPFVGEVLSGKVDSSDVNGLRLSVGFFKDIYVPVHLFPNPSKFSEDGRWVWIYEGDELNIENEEEIRFRIQSVKYPPIPVEPEKDAKPFAPMAITVSVLSLLCITYVDKFSSCSMF
ncbi:hypothetical protein Syun_029549 [Stephania yunnanensis]|uniref:DNA-directed RNA polymerase subunit n=1 Tax=Stephania yunnanensis TaxID=152371 RepID=A0AAP0E867_9MAGN